MNRPWLIWLSYGLCLTVVAAALGWTSNTVLRLDEAAARAQTRASLEEDERLALWRTDSWLASLIALENARPYFVYHSYLPANRSYGRMFNRFEPPDDLVASPLLKECPEFMLLHFQFDSDGQLSSPQVPTNEHRKLAESESIPTAQIEAADSRLNELAEVLNREKLLKLLPSTDEDRMTWNEFNRHADPDKSMKQTAEGQREFGTNEFYARFAQNRTQQLGYEANPDVPFHAAGIHAGMIRPLWLGDMLILARTVSVNGEVYLQGCWVDWPALRDTILDKTRDLLPSARLEPLPSSYAAIEASDRHRWLASLPVKLIPGDAAPIAASSVSPLGWSLRIAWLCAGLAAVAGGLLLAGVVQLSERRAAFVSAVTHELRTPLTTFRMYAEMLASGMVPDEERKRKYLDTLRIEADRLSHLVENVLAYARLERGLPQGRLATVSLAELLEEKTQRLRDRAAGAGITLTVDNVYGCSADGCDDVRLRADSSAVEQILFNLVDNACKYAADATRGTIHIEHGRQGRFVALRVRDQGPGISREQARRLFRPFCKSAQEAAHTAPGVGLGLALSRRLARDMGGDLRLEKSAIGGACFVLLLPAG